MPFPHNWVEELLVEWMHLDGFLVKVNPLLPAQLEKGGGKAEADVVGARINGNVLEIRHVEADVPNCNPNRIVSSIEKRFSPERCEMLTRYFKKLFSYESADVRYEKVFVFVYHNGRTLESVKGKLTDDVKLIRLPDLIEDIVETIREWKRHLPRRTKGAARLIMFSRTSWLLQVIDCLERNGMLKLPDRCAESSHMFLILRPYARCSKLNSHPLVCLSACEKRPVPLTAPPELRYS